ncbi:hypothetical protein FIBSPDRAFT_945372 [Athelia psychrophila]|uniref:Integral membrane protein n=1 Tax=Athelia psychrophila TaxID=1759441 RepID=A0A166U699_9AGAM|nr:hypothetical protein FIBSPDRAFT_945372 [Fibularhizoctonia sp. CBS 109695]
MDKVRDAASKVQNTLRPTPADRGQSVTSVRLAPRNNRDDIESGQGGHSSGGLFRRAMPTRASGNFFSNALANVRDFVQRDPRESSTPLAGETEPEAVERVRLAKERAEYDQQVLDLLDVIDPEVSTLSTLGDLQNSLFVPNLGRFVNRTRYLQLAKPDHAECDIEEELEHAAGPRAKRPFYKTLFARKEAQKPAVRRPVSEPGTADAHPEEGEGEPVARGAHFVLPDGLVDWDQWTPAERAELDDYVRHLLHSRKWKLRRAWRGFRQYFKTPLGAFVTIYASLLTFWGAAWVLFIIGWLPSGGRQAYFQEICDEILTALFCVVGIGLAPFRTVDTYHMIYIAKYHRKTLRLYRERGAPPLPDENDLPDPLRRRQTPGELEKQVDHMPDAVGGGGEEGEPAVVVRTPVLSVHEQATFLYHQQRFAKSHTFYRPHETATHKAFPHDLLVVVVCLLDFHSIFQIALGSTTWSISYHHLFKHTLTAVILSFSITCNITAGLVITAGNRRTRKTEVLEERLRKAVTEEAVKRKAAGKDKERERGDGHTSHTSGHAVHGTRGTRDEQGQEAADGVMATGI